VTISEREAARRTVAQRSPGWGAPDAARPAMPGRNTHKVSHLLATDLRRQILSGELAVDEKLPAEPELMARLQVSRDTLREALRILESQSLLEVRRGRGGGAVVRQPGLEAVGRYVALLLQLRKATLAHLEEARSVVEPPAAELLAARAGPDEVDHLVALHDAEREAEQDPLSFVAAVAAFDQAVIELSGNRSLSVVAGVFRDIYAGQVYSAIGSTGPAEAEQMARRVVVSHSAFLEAARRQEGSLAKRTWSDYLFTTSRMLVSRSRSRQLIDMTPLWRAQAAQAGAGPAPRRAIAVATEVRARIAEERLREGDRLPSLAELASEFEISRPTLREALRILEMEFLLDLRGGDRGGATVRVPSTQVAAQLAGIVLEARQTTLRDFHWALRLIEPAIIELVAARIGTRTLKRVEDLTTELAASVEDTGRFVATWEDAAAIVFSATQNPALTVTAEILQWVRVGTLPAIAADATALPQVARSNRKAQAGFSELVSAMATRDSVRAREVWAACQDLNVQFTEESELGERLVIDLLG
jgi:DNA-binding FadR family transcriptional regulator